MADENTSGDSVELEALFDSIASSAAGAPAGPASVQEAKPSLMQQARENDSGTDDSPELEALFDSVASQHNAKVLDSVIGQVPVSENGEWPIQDKVFKQVGQMARQLHDTLGGLGYEKFVEKTVGALPDAKDRLNYIANLTEQAACKVLNATDIATPLQDELEAGASLLAAKWDKLYDNKLDVEEFKLLANETRAYLKNAVPQRTESTKAQLMEIMMAQDFQDLTGQVIKKVIAMSQELEAQLMSVLIDTMPVEKRTDSVNSLLNGPVINADGRTDVVASQQQVDDLLDSLGF